MVRPRVLVGNIVNNPNIMVPYIIWCVAGLIIGIIQVLPPPNINPHSPFMMLIYYTNIGYWVTIGCADIIAFISPFFKWFFGA